MCHNAPYKNKKLLFSSVRGEVSVWRNLEPSQQQQNHGPSKHSNLQTVCPQAWPPLEHKMEPSVFLVCVIFTFLSPPPPPSVPLSLPPPSLLHSFSSKKYQQPTKRKRRKRRHRQERERIRPLSMPFSSYFGPVLSQLRLLLV